MTVQQTDLLGPDAAPVEERPKEPAECFIVWGSFGADWLVVSDERRERALAELGMEREPDESFLAAWLRGLAERNKVELAVIRRAVDRETNIWGNRDLARWIWGLA